MELEYIETTVLTSIHGVSAAGCRVLALLNYTEENVWSRSCHGMSTLVVGLGAGRAPALSAGRVAWESPIRRPIDGQSALIIAVNDLHHPATCVSWFWLNLRRGWSTAAACIADRLYAPDDVNAYSVCQLSSWTPLM